jgi:hypothetical protein
VWAGRGFSPKVQRAETTFVALPDALIDGRPELIDQ